MKMVKNIAIVAFATSFIFSGIGFHMANNYTNLDSDLTVLSSYGVTYNLEGKTSVGWDSNLGMMMYFDAPAGVTLRLGWTAGTGDADGSSADDLAAETSVGLGFTWWTGGSGLNTSISTNYDYVMQGTDNSTNLSVVVGFGF